MESGKPRNWRFPVTSVFKKHVRYAIELAPEYGVYYKTD